MSTMVSILDVLTENGYTTQFKAGEGILLSLVTNKKFKPHEVKINHFYTREVETMVRKLTALLEPVLIGTLGVVIGFIVIALWMPLFKVIQLIQELD